MTFNELIELDTYVTLAGIIQLFLLGDDDKIYINVYGRDDCFITNARIISSDLLPYLDKRILYLEDPCFDKNSILNIHLDVEGKINGNQT